MEKAGRDNELDLWVSDENDAAVVASAALASTDNAAGVASAAPGSSDNAAGVASATSYYVHEGVETVHAAVVAPTGPAVAAADRFIYPMDYFVNFNRFTMGYKKHNEALKALRDTNEDTTEPANSQFIRFDHGGWVDVKKVEHLQGMHYWLSDDVERWKWHEMIAMLDEESLRFVVEGQNGRSGGIIGCGIGPRKNSYDHKRHHALQQLGTHPKGGPKLPIWDFVVRRADDTQVYLHPEYSTTKFKAIELVPLEELAEHEPPRAGLGRSDGPGTFKKKSTVVGHTELGFVASRRPR